MILHARAMGLVAVLAALTVGCGNATLRDLDDGGRSSGGGGGNEQDAPSSKGFKLEWSVTNGAGLAGVDGGAAAALGGLPGVKVCVHDMPDIACATTDAKGQFQLLGLPALANVVLTLDKEGFVPASKSIQTASTDMNVNGSSILMFGATALRPPDGFERLPNTGSVDFFAIGPTDADPNVLAILSDVGIALSPSKGEGPFFFDGRGVYAPTAKSTAGGFGFYLNLPPGEYTLTFTDEKHDCAPVSAPIAGFGIPIPPTSARFTVLDGYLTEEIGVICLEKSFIVVPDGG
jgi:hypothetical protein